MLQVAAKPGRVVLQVRTSKRADRLDVDSDMLTKSSAAAYGPL